MAEKRITGEREKKPQGKVERDQRLKAALKANMAKRKAQARARADKAGTD